MPECELTKTCIFFNNQMANMPSTCEVFKKNYCEQNFESCARFMIVQTLGRGYVPPDLYPNQTQRSRDIIEGKLPQVKYK